MTEYRLAERFLCVAVGFGWFCLGLATFQGVMQVLPAHALLRMTAFPVVNMVMLQMVAPLCFAVCAFFGSWLLFAQCRYSSERLLFSFLGAVSSVVVSRLILEPLLVLSGGVSGPASWHAVKLGVMLLYVFGLAPLAIIAGGRLGQRWHKKPAVG